MSLLIHRPVFFDPVAPMLQIYQVNNTQNGTDTELRLLFDKKYVLPSSVDEINTLKHRPVFSLRQYFDIGDTLEIEAIHYCKSLLGRNKDCTIIELPNKIGELYAMVVSMPTSDYNDLINLTGTDTYVPFTIRYPKLNKCNEFQSNFCKLNGVSKWI